MLGIFLVRWSESDTRVKEAEQKAKEIRSSINIKPEMKHLYIKEV